MGGGGLVDILETSRLFYGLKRVKKKPKGPEKRQISQLNFPYGHRTTKRAGESKEA